jgi:hypothetical protein
VLVIYGGSHFGWETSVIDSTTSKRKTKRRVRRAEEDKGEEQETSQLDEEEKRGVHRPLFCFVGKEREKK